MLKSKIRSAHPVYYVANLQRTRDFYQNILGFDLAFDMQHAKVLGIQLAESALLVVSENPAKIASANAPVFVLNIDDVDAAYVALAAKGVTFDSPPTDQFYGRAAFFKDPDGYPLCLVS